MKAFASRLTYANVTSTLALVLALGAGGAYAIDKVGSADIRDGAIRGKDVKRGTVTQREVRESTLVGTEILKIAGEEGGFCTSLDTAFEECISETVRTKGRAVAIATTTGAIYTDSPGGAAAQCQLQVDGEATFSSVPGDELDSTNSESTDGFARTVVTEPLERGRHVFKLACRSTSGTPSVNSATISVIAVATR